MENPINKIIIDFSIEYNLDENLIQPVIQKLNQEFFIRIKDMKNLSFKKWKEYNLPGNLYNILKEKYDEALKLQENKPKKIKKNGKKTSFKYLNVYKDNSFSIGIRKIEKENLIIKKDSINLNGIENNLTNLENKIKDHLTMNNIYKIFDVMIHNIITNSTVERFKKINIKKINSKYPYDEITEIFNLMKFDKIPNSDYIDYTRDVNLLSDAYNIIANRRKKYNEIMNNIQNNNNNIQLNKNLNGNNENNQNNIVKNENYIISTNNNNTKIYQKNIEDNLNDNHKDIQINENKNEKKPQLGINIQLVVEDSSLGNDKNNQSKKNINENTNIIDNNNIQQNILDNLYTKIDDNNNENLYKNNNQINNSQNNKFYENINNNDMNNIHNYSNDNNGYNYQINTQFQTKKINPNINYENNRLIYSTRIPSNYKNSIQFQNQNNLNEQFNSNYNMSNSINLVNINSNNRYINEINNNSPSEPINNSNSQQNEKKNFNKSQIVNYFNPLYQEKTIPELLIEENSRRNNIILNTPINHNPSCFFLTNIKNIDKLLKKYSIQYIYQEKDSNHIKSISQIINMQTNESNKNESNKLKKLIETPIITKGDIYFIFPDKYIIKTTFCLYEKVKDLYQFVKNYLNNPKNSFMLYNNNNVIDLMNTDIMMLNLSFPLTLKITFKNTYNGLKENELNKLTVNVF